MTFFQYQANAETPVSTPTPTGTSTVLASNVTTSPDVFFGVTFGGNTTAQAKLLIDKVKGYTNLFVVDSWDITTNETALNEICEYAVDAKLNIMVYFDFVLYAGNVSWFHTWLDTVRGRWGNNFLGIYLYDEPGGSQIDTGQWRTGPTAKKAMENSSDYNDAANRFVTNIPSTPSWQNVRNSCLPIFTSDYALYWFDYLAGYDTVFVELGWNQSTTQNIALGRGAANVQGKQWGAIITWTYNDPPYMENGTEMLKDMNMAYGAGAKYIIVFNYPYLPDNPYGVLTEDHFNAMQTFWNEIQNTPRSKIGEVHGTIAYVLPKNYGWGMRTPSDNIWGYWPADNQSTLIWNNMMKLLNQYGPKLDIIYDDSNFNYQQDYSTVYYWNSTTIALATSTVTSTLSSGTTGLSPTYIIALVATVAIVFIIPITLVYRRRASRKRRY